MKNLEALIQNHAARVGIVGLGYVGIPLVRAFIEAGFRVLGFDVDHSKVKRLAAGESYIGHIPSAWIHQCVTEGTFEPTFDMGRLGEADALLVCVPTPLAEGREPDLSYVRNTIGQIAKTLRPGQLVVLESTTWPGTTREVVLPILAAAADDDWQVGRDYYVAYSPEREDPGNPDFGARRIPKVVGGIDPTSALLASLLYRQVVVEVVEVSSPEVAEAAKLLENTYRAVNIALVNELKVLYDRMGIDVWEVIEAARTKPFGFQPFYPGPGLGGHCIPIDPFYLSWVARRHGCTTRFIELAGETNSRMPEYVISRLADALNQQKKPINGSRILVLGLAYKKDVDDPRESPSFELIAELRRGGARVIYNDPHIGQLPAMRRWGTPDELPEELRTSQHLTPQLLAAQDCVLIATDHSAYDYDEIVQHARLVVDTRNATRSVTKGREKIHKA